MTRRGTARDVLLAAILLAGSPAGATPELIEFARCLKSAGATFYTAAWCPHCRRQEEMFGKGLGYLRTVDCTDGCEGVRSLPTWTFRNGTRLSGVASFDLLATRTGCRFGGSGQPAETEQPTDRASRGAAPNERYIGGAKIIEVPRR
jgi:hypothetical protein